MKGVINIQGVIGEDTTLLDVIRQYKSYKGLTEVEVIINSVGGSVDSGQSIFSYLRNLQIPVTTVAVKAYSVASIVFMAGDVRIVEAGSDRLMIHNPWISNFSGGSDDLIAVSKELKSIENDFIKFYSTYTNIDTDSISQLLKNETFLSADEALEIGLATEVKESLQAVAYYNKEEDKKIMTKTEKFINAMNAFFGSDSDIKALLIQDANGDEISFPDLAETDEPQVGDNAVDADNKPIEGERVTTDGSTMIFEAGELKEIIPAESEEEVEETEEEVVEEEVAETVAEEVAEEEIDFEAILKVFEEGILAKIKAENDSLKAEIVAMKKLVGSPEATVEARTTINNKVSKNYLRS
ncbi:Clp protease ClpP [Psychroserpens mesophilus]|uniref:Clp protease ClpP n=1 Tax=Psychroserpens mesophilus TaxID=325473 RepID=UPI003D6483D8